MSQYFSGERRADCHPVQISWQSALETYFTSQVCGDRLPLPLPLSVHSGELQVRWTHGSEIGHLKYSQESGDLSLDSVSLPRCSCYLDKSENGTFF